MAQKQQQQKLSNADAIRLYWTPERIRSAVPKERYSVSGKKQAIDLANDPPKTVPDATRKTSPYQSVGILFFTQTIKGKVEHFQGTAYVAETGKGNNIVFTAAHNLLDDDGPSENFLFIPACQNDGKEVPAYGSFTGASYVVATGWTNPEKPYQPCYDMGAIKLAKKEAGQNAGEVVAMLGYAVDHEDIKDVTEWRIIGYRRDIATNQDIMYESDGVYIESQDDGKSIRRTNPTKKQGMSGSPWLLKNGDGNFAIANGVQIGSGVDYAAAAYFSKTLVDDIIAQL